MSDQNIKSTQPDAPRPRSTEATGRKPRRDKHPGAPSELDCFQAFVELGEERTLPLLAQVLFDQYGAAAPSLPTLRRMSCGTYRRTGKIGGRHGNTTWADRLREHDLRVEAKLKERLVEAQAKAKFDEIAALKGVIEESLTLAQASLAGGNDDPAKGRAVTGLKLEGNVREITELLKTAVEASKHVQLLTGGATSRAENINRELRDDLSDEELLRLYGSYVQRGRSEGQATH